MYDTKGGESGAVSEEIAFEKTERSYTNIGEKELRQKLTELDQLHTKVSQDVSLTEEARLDKQHAIIEEKAEIYQELLDRSKTEAANYDNVYELVRPIDHVSKEKQKEIRKIEEKFESERLEILSLPLGEERGLRLSNLIERKIKAFRAVDEKYNKKAGKETNNLKKKKAA